MDYIKTCRDWTYRWVCWLLCFGLGSVTEISAARAVCVWGGGAFLPKVQDQNSRVGLASLRDTLQLGHSGNIFEL